MSKKNVLILGGEGYLGHPIKLNLSSQEDKFDVMSLDNYFKDKIAVESESECLNPIRMRTRNDMGFKYNYRTEDITNYDSVKRIFKEFKPDIIIHLAEQPSGPYSLLGIDEAQKTVSNNLIGTLNILWAMRDYARDAHLIKFGTAGEYGESNVDIPEGWLEYEYKGRKDKRLFPRQAGSLYHTTKVLDTDLIWFFVRMYGLRVTDLMQGPVYGIYTDEITPKNIDELGTKFYYDDIFGTVVNRFVTQVVAGEPLTVYGKGGQTRGYINLRDVIQCINLIIDNPPDNGVLDIYNQITETFTVNQIAEKVVEAANDLGYHVKVKHLDNPRKEAEEHYYKMEHDKYRDLGLVSHFMTKEVLKDMIVWVEGFRDKIDKYKIKPRMTWG